MIIIIDHHERIENQIENHLNIIIVHLIQIHENEVGRENIINQEQRIGRKIVIETENEHHYHQRKRIKIERREKEIEIEIENGIVIEREKIEKENQDINKIENIGRNDMREDILHNLDIIKIEDLVGDIIEIIGV